MDGYYRHFSQSQVNRVPLSFSFFYSQDTFDRVTMDILSSIFLSSQDMQHRVTRVILSSRFLYIYIIGSLQSFYLSVCFVPTAFSNKFIKIIPTPNFFISMSFNNVQLRLFYHRTLNYQTFINSTSRIILSSLLVALWHQQHALLSASLDLPMLLKY